MSDRPRWKNTDSTDNTTRTTWADMCNILTSRQLVILETSWAPWQHRMNPARLRSTHTTDSRTNTLTWRWRHGGVGVVGLKEEGVEWITVVWTRVPGPVDILLKYNIYYTTWCHSVVRDNERTISGSWNVAQVRQRRNGRHQIRNAIWGQWSSAHWRASDHWWEGGVRHI